MKIRPSVTLLVVTAVVLLGLALWLGGKRAETPMVYPEQTNTVPPVAENTQVQSPRPSPVLSPLTQASAPQPGIPEGTNADAPGNKAERMREVLSNYNHQPIVYYGRLEDQFSNPVSDATIDFAVRVISGRESTTKRGQVKSDATGGFTITGYTGQDLALNPQKAGYAIASTNRFANYSRLFPEEERIQPDPNNPVVIRMWKLQQAEPLLGINKQFKLHYTNDPIFFDLLRGEVVQAGGDIKLTVGRAPGVMSGRNPLDWSVQVEAVNGGVMESAGQEAITYSAPADGYQTSVAIAFTTNAWNGAFNRGLFVMSRGGQVYSKIGLSFTINEKPEDLMYVGFSGVANTNGSRNWEGAPNTYKQQ